ICLPDELERLKAVAGKLKIEEILRAITILQDCNERFARCTSKRIELEMTFVKLCSNTPVGEAAAAEQVQSQNAEAAAMMKRLAVLEERLRNGVVAAAAPQQTPAPKPKEYDPELKQLSECNDGPVKEWNDIVDKIRERIHAVGSFLKGSVAFIKGSNLFLIVQSDIYLKKFKASQDASIINDVLSETYGKTFNIKVKSAKKAAPDDAEDPTNQLIAKARENGIEVEIKN
ncbi:MAG: DNA polymerase III subunit gamma/tau, partial [Ruminococcus sp.]|nr:DNA polymerase III subunit gamma/tau [Ruminococcus sp.]